MSLQQPFGQEFTPSAITLQDPPPFNTPMGSSRKGVRTLSDDDNNSDMPKMSARSARRFKRNARREAEAGLPQRSKSKVSSEMQVMTPGSSSHLDQSATFFEAHRPFRLQPGVRVVVVEENAESDMLNQADSVPDGVRILTGTIVDGPYKSHDTLSTVVEIALDDGHQHHQHQVAGHKIIVAVEKLIPEATPFASLGEVYSQYVHIDAETASAVGGEPRGSLVRSIPQYGPIHISDARNSVHDSLDNHASCGPTLSQLRERDDQLRAFELERSQEHLAEWVSSGIGVRGNPASAAGEWVELPLTLLQSFYKAGMPLSMASTAEMARATPMIATNNEGSSGAEFLKRISARLMSSIRLSISWCRCFRRDSAAPLWNAALLADVPRPVRVAPAGAEIRCSAWHPARHRLAVAVSDRSVYIHVPTVRLASGSKSEEELRGGWLPCVLRHQFQREISCMEWQPLSGNGLAVGCESGICFWRLENTDMNQKGTQVDQGGRRSDGASTHGGFAWCEFLCADDIHHTPVNTLSWSPDGRLLASGSVCSDQVLVWDMVTGIPTPITAVATVGVSLVKWSPGKGHYLFAGTLSKVIRVWETKTWTGERWTIPEGSCQTACWNPTGKMLMLGVAGSPHLWTFSFHHSPPDIFGTLADTRLDVSNIWGEGHVGSDSSDSDDPEHASSIGRNFPGAAVISRKKRVAKRQPQKDDETFEKVRTPRSIRKKRRNRSKLCVREIAWSKDSYGQRIAVTVNLKGAQMPRYHKPSRTRSRRHRKVVNESKGADLKKSRKKGRRHSKSPKRRHNQNDKLVKASVLAGQEVDEGVEATGMPPPLGHEEQVTGAEILPRGDNPGDGEEEEEIKAHDSADKRMDSQQWEMSEFGSRALRPGEDLILIYSVQIQPALRLTPRGFLRGPPGACKPFSLNFWPGCTTGALLSACWLNGEVTVYPLLFRTERNLLRTLNGQDLGYRERPDEYDDEEAMEKERLAAESQLVLDRTDW